MVYKKNRQFPLKILSDPQRLQEPKNWQQTVSFYTLCALEGDEKPKPHITIHFQPGGPWGVEKTVRKQASGLAVLLPFGPELDKES